MRIIRDLFDQARPIDRRIVSVINYAADAEDLLKAEISEYEVTDSLARHYERFMINLDAGFKGGGGHEIAVWVSGFYGSGKSSFTKYLGFALDPRRRVGSEPFLTYLQSQLPTQALRSQLGTLAKNFPATVIMIDLAAVASGEAAGQGISRLVYHKVLEWAGYSKDEKIALLELMIERDNLQSRFQELLAAEGYHWSELQDDLLAANSIVGRVACKLYPKLWKDESGFARVKVDSIYGEDERLRQMLDLIERRTKNRRVIFILDEVGQFIEGTDRLITNLQGLAENLKHIGKGQAWVVATAQQTLPMAGPLFKLKDRFPEFLRIDIESTDIREITYRRLLKKSPEATQLLKKLFSEHAGALTAGTQLRNTKHIQTHLDAEVFARLYPFLPPHFDVLMELLRSLAKSTGGIGLRSTLKVIQDVLVDIRGQQSGTLLADRKIGELATADIFYNTLRPDIERANRSLVETVAKVGNAYGENSIYHRSAKAIAVLQLVEGFPVSLPNVAAMLHPAAAATPQTEAVEAAVKELRDDKSLPLEEIDGSLRFMSEAVSQILSEQVTLHPSSSDEQTILSGILRDEIFSPEPSARLESTKAVKAQVKLLRGSSAVPVTHGKEDLEIHLDLVPPAEMAARKTDRLNDSRAPVNKNLLYLLGENSSGIRDLIVRIYRCEEIQRRHMTEVGEVSQFIRAQKTRAESLKRDLDTALQNAFVKGSFVFRGTDTPVSNRGSELRAACNAQLGFVAAEVYPSYRLAPQNLDANAAEKLLLVPDLATISSALDPLGLVDKAGRATRIRAEHPALLAIIDYLRRHGEVDGRKLLDDFNHPEFGWFKDTTRYLVAGLLICQAVRVKVGGQWLEAVGPRAIEGLKNNNSFLKVDIATNDKQIPQETLNRAAKRLLDITGENVLPMAPRISQAVLKHFPAFRNDYAALPAELTAVSLPGRDRAQSLVRQLAQILDRDASDAPNTLGAEESALVDNLSWARSLRKALDDGLGANAAEGSTLLTGIGSLPKVGVLEGLATATGAIRDELRDLLGREDFFSSAGTIRNRLLELKTRVAGAAAELRAEIEQYLIAQRDAITTGDEWASLPEGDRAELSGLMEGLTLPDGGDLDGIKRLLNRRMEMDARLAQVRSLVNERSRSAREQKEQPPEIPVPDPGQVTRRVRLRRRYTAADQSALEQAVTELSSGLASLQSEGAGAVTIDLE